MSKFRDRILRKMRYQIIWARNHGYPTEALEARLNNFYRQKQTGIRGKGKTGAIKQAAAFTASAYAMGMGGTLASIAKRSQVPSVAPGYATDQPPDGGAQIAPSAQVGEPEPMDLGNIFTDLGSAYINARYSQPAPRPVMQSYPGMTSQANMVQPALAMPDMLGGGDLSFDMPFLDYTAGKKKRRRRRRLLTSSDLNDLALLKTLTGNNDAFKAAVVKAVRR